MTNATKVKTMLAFVLMPFQDEFDELFNLIIKPSLENEGYTVKKADSDFNQRNILKKIIEGITTADLILADITTLNANVMYELGIAHALQKPTIIIVQDVEVIPFDLKPYQVNVYSTHYQQINNLVSTLRNIAINHKSKSVSFDNPIADFAPSQTPKNEHLSQEHETFGKTVDNSESNADDELGILDLSVEVEQAGLEMQKWVTRQDNYLNDLKHNIEKRTSEIQSLQNDNQLGSSSRKHKLINLAAIDMNTYSENVESDLPNLYIALETYTNNFTDVLGKIPIVDDADLQAANTLLSQMEGLRTTFDTVYGQVDSFRESIMQLKHKNISRELNRAVNKTDKAVSGILEGLSTGSSNFNRIIVMIQTKIDDYKNKNQTD